MYIFPGLSFSWCLCLFRMKKRGERIREAVRGQRMRTASGVSSSPQRSGRRGDLSPSEEVSPDRSPQRHRRLLFVSLSAVICLTGCRGYVEKKRRGVQSTKARRWGRRTRKKRRRSISGNVSRFPASATESRTFLSSSSSSRRTAANPPCKLDKETDTRSSGSLSPGVHTVESRDSGGVYDDRRQRS